MNTLENRLRSWRPRRPSAALKLRLAFARAAAIPRMLRFAGWLTPATACVLLALLSLNSENAASLRRLPSLSLASIISNDNYAVYTTCHQSQQNNLSVFTSDWTNRSGSASIISFPQAR